MIKIAVLGAGSHSRHNHGPALAMIRDRMPDAIKLHTVCDLDLARAQSYAREFGFEQTCSSLNELLERDRPDAIVAVTPLEQTLELAGAILRAGIPAMIEKPTGVDVAQARELAEIAATSATPHMVSFNRRFSPAIVAGSRWMRKRVEGPRLITARMLRVGRTEAHFVSHTGIHLVDAVLSLAPDPIAVEAKAMGRSGESPAWAARIEFAGGSSALLVIAPCSGADEESYQVVGSGWCVDMDTHRSRAVIREEGREVLCAESGSEPAFIKGGTQGETEAFVESLSSGKWREPNAFSSLKAMAVCEAIEKGAGRTILK